VIPFLLVKYTRIYRIKNKKLLQKRKKEIDKNRKTIEPLNDDDYTLDLGLDPIEAHVRHMTSSLIFQSK
jgi:hypothetical protein